MPLPSIVPPERAGRRLLWWFLAVLVLLAALAVRAQAPAPSTASSATPCPPPKKFAAGACVSACPAGYEDRGRDCVFRSLSR